MKDILFWLAIGGGEVLLFLLVLLTIYWWRHSAAARRDRAAVAQLVKAVREGRQAREATIQGFLAERMGLQGAALDQARVAILREELGLLQRFAAIYGRRDAGAAAQFHLALEAAVAPYLELQGSGASAASGTGDAGELEALRLENQRLSEELSVTMETMSRMLNEYSSMFAGGVPDAMPESVAPVEAGEPEEGEGENGEEAPAAVSPVAGDEASEAGSETPPVREPVALDEAVLDIGAAGGESVLTEESAQADDAARMEATSDTVPVEQTPDEPVAPEAIDELLANDPLADELGDLFDEEELASLEEDGAGEGGGKEEKAIAI